METAPDATLALSAVTPVPVPLARRGRPSTLRRPVAFAAVALGCLVAGAAMLVLAAGTYTAKRRLDIDVVPGLDVLPDRKIERLIRAAAGVFRP